jgi:hypothetical protein
MARHTIPITNGKGSIELVNGVYNATAVEVMMLPL